VQLRTLYVKSALVAHLQLFKGLLLKKQGNLLKLYKKRYIRIYVGITMKGPIGGNGVREDFDFYKSNIVKDQWINVFLI